MNIPLPWEHERAARQKELKASLEAMHPEVGEFFCYGSASKTESEYFRGSEFTQTFDEDSDYDFAVEWTQQTENVFNNDPRWVLRDSSSYQDATTLCIFQRILDEEMVQVSLRLHFSDFKAVWRSISPQFYWTYINKRSPMFFGKEGVHNHLDNLLYLRQGIYNDKPSVFSKKSIRSLDQFPAVQEALF